MGNMQQMNNPQARQQQMMHAQSEQKRKLEENRKKLEEVNQRRIQEQQHKMDELKRQQAEFAAKATADKKRKEEEAQKKKDEQRAAITVRRAIQEMRTVRPENHDVAKKGLGETMEKELEACGSKMDKIKEECEAVMEYAMKRVQEVQDKRRQEEERKAEEERKKTEVLEKAQGLLKELSTLIDTAQEAKKVLEAEAEPFSLAEPLEEEKINDVATACESAGQEAKTKASACLEFIAKNNYEMKVYMPAMVTPAAKKEDGEEDAPKPLPTPTLKELSSRAGETSRSIEQLMRSVTANTVKFAVKAKAGKKLKGQQAIFTKYATKKEKHFTSKELAAYAKGEFKFTLLAAEADSICKALVVDGQKGITSEAFQRLKTSVGIAVEKQKDAKRKEGRVAREKELDEKKQKIVQTAEEAVKVIEAADAKLKEAEEAAKPLMGKVQELKSQEMIPMADSVSDLIKMAKDATSEAEKASATISEGVDPDLARVAQLETTKVKNKMAKFPALTKFCEDQVSKFRGELAKKEAAELDKFRSDAIKLIRLYQKTKVTNVDDTYKVFDSTGSGKVGESEFTAFFTGAAKLPPVEPKNGEDAEVVPQLSETDLSRLFSSLDDQGEGSLSKEAVVSMIRCYMKVTKETVMTEAQGIKDAKTVRRLEVNEICEVLDGPVREESVGIIRYRVKALKDSAEGWATPVSDQGTVFLAEQEGGVSMKVTKETILTSTFDIADSSGKTLKKLKVGEIVSVLQWMQKEEKTGLSRMKVKVGSLAGWATAVGNSGNVFLELA